MRRILRWPVSYAVAYLVLIPAFGGLYLWNADEFFHSTIRFEKGTAEEVDSVRGRLNRTIIHEYRGVRSSRTIRSDRRFGELPKSTWEADVTEVTVADLQVSDSSDAEQATVTFDVLIPATTTTLNRVNGATVQHLSVSVPLQSPYAEGSVAGSFDFKPIAVVGREAEFPFRAADVFPRRHPAATGGKPGPVLAVPGDVQTDLEDLWHSNQGRAAGIARQFGRFLYLSAVTITTLGYGDIVPIGTIARALVAIESVLGIVVIGAFLGTLYTSRHESRHELDGP